MIFWSSKPLNSDYYLIDGSNNTFSITMNKATLTLLYGLLITPVVSRAGTEQLLSMSLEDLALLEVHIATGTPKLLSEAPAATSVITAEELTTLGVQTLEEALETVPALHVSRGSFQYGPRYFIRGIVSTYNPQTLFLVNGIPMTSLFLGDRGERLPNRHSMPVLWIQRIEIIRGPGSALYGADAFAGVINIITKNPDDIETSEARMSWGTGQTGEATVIQPAHIGEWRGLFAVDVVHSDGAKVIIKRDIQSVIDDMGFAPPASQAPAAAGLSLSYWQTRTEWQNEHWQWRLSWLQVDDSGVGQGINDALDRGASFKHRRGTADLTWHDENWRPDWQLEAQLSYLYGDFSNPTRIYVFPVGGVFGSFPDGVVGQPELQEENARFNITSLYQGWENHQIRLGSGFYWGDLFHSNDKTNYIFNGTIPIPRGYFQDVSDTDNVFQPEAQRTNSFAFAQDEWMINNQWSLTSGVRIDHFSDVGAATNPRLALIWQTTPQFTTKLMYGEAFRAPTLFELYAKSNPVALGNPNLKPEQLHSSELAFSWRPHTHWTFDLNVYRLHIDDYIDFVNNTGAQTFTAQNVGHIEGKGFEAELHYQWRPNWLWLVNYSYQNTQNRDNKTDLGQTPSNKLYLRTVWDSLPRWQIALQATHQGSTKRPANDPRDTLAGYTTVDLTIRHQLTRTVALTLAGRNLADADAVDASRGPSPTLPSPSFYYDLPQVGRSAWLTATWHW